ncbi:MAG: hypothetical protein JSW09_07205 [Pseudomonadota bacterium]|nr:MAG: hypothetical protein JSW09_07205 [Pseudomonadota bacterium]
MNARPMPALCTLRRVIGAIVVACLATLAAAAGAAPGGTDEAQVRLAANKLALVKSLLDKAPAVARAEREGSEEAKRLMTTARAAYAEAVAACDTDSARCISKADEALKAITAATRLAPAAPNDESRARARYAQLQERIREFRDALARVALPNTVAPADLATVDRLTREAEQHAAQGRWTEAVTVLARGAEKVETELSRVLDRQTVIHPLSFAGAADEYAYEQERFRSLQLLTQLMLAERPELAASRATIEGLMASSVQMRDESAALAASGDVSGALQRLEEATNTLVRVLRMSGVPMQ